MNLWFPLRGFPSERRTGHQSLSGVDPGDGLPTANLSPALLKKIPHRLDIVSVKGVRWSDWGNEGRTREALGRIGRAEGLMARFERRYRRWDHT